MHVLRQLQHIVGIAGLRAVDVVDEVDAGLLAGEVFTTRVAAKGERTLTRHDIPEEIGSVVITLITREFADSLKSHHLRHLGVGMHVVEIVLSL